MLIILLRNISENKVFLINYRMCLHTFLFNLSMSALHFAHCVYFLITVTGFAKKNSNDAVWHSSLTEEGPRTVFENTSPQKGRNPC